MAGVATTTTSAGVAIGDRTKISVSWVTSGLSSGNVTLKTQVSNDYVNWVDYNRLVSNVAAGTAFTTVTIRSNQTQIAFVPGQDTFSYLRAVMGYNTAATALVTVTLVGVIPGQ